MDINNDNSRNKIEMDEFEVWSHVKGLMVNNLLHVKLLEELNYKRLQEMWKELF